MENDRKITSLDLAEPMVPISPEQKQELAQLRERFIHLVYRIMNDEKFDLSQVYPDTDDLGKLYDQLDDLKKCLDSFRPFNPAQVENLREFYDTQYTYESNAIEGNSLTLHETSMVVNEGITIGGKPMRDHLEAINHAEAVKSLHDFVANQEPFSEKVLLHFHSLILHGIQSEDAGRYRSGRVRVGGSQRIFPNPLKVPDLMEEYFAFYEEHKNTMHPVEMAAHLHQKLVNIHPFVDGNGRASRLVMNLHLLQNGYPVTILSAENQKRHAYYRALEAFNDGDDTKPFELLIAQYVKHWCFEFLSMLAPNIGESEQNKGYYYFKKIEPHLPQGK